VFQIARATNGEMSLDSGSFDGSHLSGMKATYVIPIVIQIGLENRKKANRNSNVGPQAIPANRTMFISYRGG